MVPFLWLLGSAFDCWPGFSLIFIAYQWDVQTFSAAMSCPSMKIAIFICIVKSDQRKGNNRFIPLLGVNSLSSSLVLNFDLKLNWWDFVSTLVHFPKIVLIIWLLIKWLCMFSLMFKIFLWNIYPNLSIILTTNFTWGMIHFYSKDKVTGTYQFLCNVKVMIDRSSQLGLCPKSTAPPSNTLPVWKSTIMGDRKSVV